MCWLNFVSLLKEVLSQYRGRDSKLTAYFISLALPVILLHNKKG